MSVREVKSMWPQVQRTVQQGEKILVLNHGKPAARILPPTLPTIENWDDHLATAIPNRGKSSLETINADRGGRW